MTMYPEVMPDAQQKVLREFGPIATDAGFYLGGGTALAIQLGHRRSVDLDWFTEEKILDPLQLAASLRSRQAVLEISSTASGTLHAISEGVRLSFLEFRYPLLSPIRDWPEYGCGLATRQDLACMKLSAIAQRGSRKDFVDVYALLRVDFTLAEMLDFYCRRFQILDAGHVLMSLTYFDDAEEEDMPIMLWDVGWDHIRRSIEAAVSGYTQRPDSE